MKRRVCLAVLLLMLVSLLPVAPVTAASSSDRSSALDYNLARSRAAMAKGAKRVGPVPEKPANYLDGRPIGWRHSDEPVSLTQPDGSTFKARGLELEEGGGQATLGGFLVTQTDNGWWHYGARRDNGRIRSLGAVVGRDDAPAAAEATRMPAAFRSQLAEFTENAEQMEKFRHSQAMAEAAAAAEAGEPVVFKIPALMYKVNAEDFQDDSTPERFQQHLSGIGTTETGTVTEMYLEQSFGKMVIEIDVYGPYEGPLSQVPCGYGTDGAPITGDVLGLGGGGAKGMAAEAVPLSDPDVDYAQYDNDSDGWVDFLTILHSGPDAAATGDPCHVWSHYIGPIVGEPAAVTTDGVLIGAVLTIPEVDLQIGVTAHEIMHALGEPDYYGTAGTAGTGDWDLGAGGSWAGIPAQTNPVHFNPVMKINFGWIKPTLVTKTALNQALRPRASYADMLQVPLKIAKAGSEEAELCDRAPVGIEHQNVAFYNEAGDCLVEGFLIENVNPAAAKWSNARLDCRFQPADFDRQLYAAGLMVWHWDFTNYVQLGNNNVMRPMLDIEEFDRRDARQDTATNTTRGQPLDPFWGDTVGVSGATQVAPTGGPGLPAAQSWDVAGPPTAGATEADPVREWVAADVPEGTGMVVTLEWGNENDDWDLGVDQFVDADGEGGEAGEWVEVGSSAGGAPSTKEQVTVFEFAAGERYRARAYNWLAVDPSAKVTVDYSTAGLTQLGPPGTRDNDLKQTGWQLTNIRPNDYTGLAHEAALPRTPIRLDVIKHTDQTVDVSGDFLHRAGDVVAPFVAGKAVTLATNVYNHGGKAVDNATFSLYDGDPADGGQRLARKTVDLAGFARNEVEFSYTPRRGLNDLYVVAAAAGDKVAGNNVVHTELEAYGGNGDVLIVDNDFGWTFEEDYEATLNSLGVSYDIVEGEPTPDVLGRYDVVVWITTTVSGDQGVLSDEAQKYIGEYLDAGGRLWLASTRAAGYLTTRDAEWLAGYFGIEIEQNLLNSPGTIAGLGGQVGGERKIDIGYMDGKPYIDYGQVPDEGVKGTAKALFTHELIPIAEQDRVDVVATSVEGSSEAGNFRTIYGLPINLVQDPGERLKLTGEILDFFGVDTGAPAAPRRLAVRFNRFQMVQDEQPWRVTVGAVGRQDVDKVALLHRPYGTRTWRSLALKKADDGLYSGVIPGKQIPNNGLEYFARVTTSGGRVVDVDGGAAMPNVATAPYGDPAQDPKCAAAGPTDDGRGKPDGGSGLGPAGDDRGRGGPVLPATGMRQGLTLGAALFLLGFTGLTGLRRRRADQQ